MPRVWSPNSEKDSKKPSNKRSKNKNRSPLEPLRITSTNIHNNNNKKHSLSSMRNKFNETPWNKLLRLNDVAAGCGTSNGTETCLVRKLNTKNDNLAVLKCTLHNNKWLKGEPKYECMLCQMTYCHGCVTKGGYVEEKVMDKKLNGFHKKKSKKKSKFKSKIVPKKRKIRTKKRRARFEDSSDNENDDDHDGNNNQDEDGVSKLMMLRKQINQNADTKTLDRLKGISKMINDGKSDSNSHQETTTATSMAINDDNTTESSDTIPKPVSFINNHNHNHNRNDNRSKSSSKRKRKLSVDNDTSSQPPTKRRKRTHSMNEQESKEQPSEDDDNDNDEMEIDDPVEESHPLKELEDALKKQDKYVSWLENRVKKQAKRIAGFQLKEQKMKALVKINAKYREIINELQQTAKSLMVNNESNINEPVDDCTDFTEVDKNKNKNNATNTDLVSGMDNLASILNGNNNSNVNELEMHNINLSMQHIIDMGFRKKQIDRAVKKMSFQKTELNEQDVGQIIQVIQTLSESETEETEPIVDDNKNDECNQQHKASEDKSSNNENICNDNSNLHVELEQIGTVHNDKQELDHDDNDDDLDLSNLAITPNRINNNDEGEDSDTQSDSPTLDSNKPLQRPRKKKSTNAASSRNQSQTKEVKEENIANSGNTSNVCNNHNDKTVVIDLTSD